MNKPKIDKKGAPKKITFCILLISPVTKILKSWHIIYLKGELRSSMWSTRTFLYIIRGARYKQNNCKDAVASPKPKAKIIKK